MEIKIERTPEQVELVKAMASKNRKCCKILYKNRKGLFFVFWLLLFGLKLNV